jgi:Zn-dependent M28 family amino/carboxypeptidase
MMIVCFVAGIGSPSPMLRLLSFPSALAVLGVFLLSLQADLTPYTVGANDNASGAGVVLSTAAALTQHPLTHTSVWVVLSGCEEVGCYGADAFARTHSDEMGRPIWISLDGVGGGGARPAYLTRETFLLTTRSDANLVALADLVSANHPEFEAQTRMFSGAYTEGAIGGKHGFRVLTLSSFAEGSKLTEWHRPTDTVENMDPAVLERSEAFLWEMLQAIDQQAGTEAR